MGLKAVVGCQRCGSFDVTYYGNYSRKKAGVPIIRLKCNNCGACLGWLPPFLLPRKHYTVSDLAEAIEAYALGGNGLVKTYQGQATAEFSLETFRRWVVHFRQLAPAFLKLVRKLLAETKPDWRFEKAKRLFKASVSNVKVELYQLFVLRDYFNHLITAEDYLPWLLFLRSTRFTNDQKQLKRDNKPQPP